MACGLLSGFSTATGASDWYQALGKPPGNPPAWVFGPVWTVLYLMMGVSAGLMANARNLPALGFFALQLLLNLIWTPVFFGLHRIDAALGILILLWGILFITIQLARRVGRGAAWLLIPYLAWISYALYLNAGIFVLNETGP